MLRNATARVGIVEGDVVVAEADAVVGGLSAEDRSGLLDSGGTLASVSVRLDPPPGFTGARLKAARIRTQTLYYAEPHDYAVTEMYVYPDHVRLLCNA